MFRFVDLHRERPHPHRLGREGRINLRGVGSSLSQQAESPGASISVIRSWISATEFIGVCRDNREVRIHCPKFGFF